jgi:hypothetical protein
MSERKKVRENKEHCDLRVEREQRVLRFERKRWERIKNIMIYEKRMTNNKKYYNFREKCEKEQWVLWFEIKKGEREQRILRFEREKLRENTEYCDVREKVEREQGYQDFRGKVEK